MSTGPLRFRYRFRFPSGGEMETEVEVDPATLESAVPEGEAPDWARLSFHRCPHCPLGETDFYCPLALRLSPLLGICAGISSHDPVEVEATSPEQRTLRLSTTAQRAFSSLMGLVIATSGCPYTVFLKPMARFHLPLAGEEETLYRAASMYLLAQYFRHGAGMPEDRNLAGLKQIYRDLQVVNTAMAERLRAVAEQDSAVNALVLLDLFAKTVPYSIEESLADVRYLFAPYLRKEQ